MKVILLIKTKSTEAEFPLAVNCALSIGRSRSSRIKVSDDKISSQHCELSLKYDRLEIWDLDSKNGTYLNGIRIEQSEVFIGDEIRIGSTIVTLHEPKMLQDSVNALTFPGPHKDRMSYELKADFTGARSYNQSKAALTVEQIAMAHKKEIEIRKKAKSSMKLSKHEIHSRYKAKSLISTALDSVMLVTFLCLLVAVISKFIPDSLDKSQKSTVLVILMGSSAVAYLVINFKMMKFTIGEKISGIKKIYSDQ